MKLSQNRFFDLEDELLHAAFHVAAFLMAIVSANADIPGKLASLIDQSCFECHDQDSAKGDLDLTALTFDLKDQAIRERWILIHDRVSKGEMPPKAEDVAKEQRAAFVNALAASIYDADHAEVIADGRGPLRRLNRDEYEHNLRDVLQLPNLDIRDMLPEDREGHHFNKTTETLDMSRVQLTAYLDAAEAALRQAIVSESKPPRVTKFRAVGTALFPSNTTFGGREAMFFAKHNEAVTFDKKTPKEDVAAAATDDQLELALFRSAHWPYYGYPKGFVAKMPGEYQVRFSARAVLQQSGHSLTPAKQPVPMTFRARKPSGPDVSGDVRATGGIMDIQLDVAVYETTVRLLPSETVEYSLLGLPVPLARNVNGGPPTYRYPPFPEGGQPGVAFQWLEIEGPLAPETWPPSSHRVLFDDLGIEPTSTQPEKDAKRLLRRFVNLAAREPLPDEAMQKFEELILTRLARDAPFADAMLAGYKAFLCSSHFLYLHEPEDADDYFAIASRLSHFLTNTRPDARLTELARNKQLRDATTLRSEAERLIAGDDFSLMVENFTDYWLNLRHVRRDEPDIRLYPEYRFDDYLIESIDRETRAFFTAMVHDNLPASVLVDADFIFANDRLAQQYGLPPLSGSTMRKVTLPEDSPLGGLLTQSAILKVTANGTTTSPVVRGAWIMERLMGDAPPPPPSNVPAVEPDIRGAKTIRDLLALHTKSKSCAACHARFDPVGLALENFDILGGWRTRYRGMEEGEKVTGIDRAGHDFAYTLASNVDASGKLLDGTSFQNIRDLKSVLAANPRQLARNLLHQFTLYATGTPVRFSDRPEIEAMLDACAGEDYRVRDLIVALVQSKIFLGQAGCQ
ncbi:MAG: DUF1588 domain-containing protein [Verrucomicrobiales bacterium]